MPAERCGLPCRRLTIQDEIDRSLNTLNSLAQELSDETASWCSVLQNEADRAAAGEDAGDSTESALAALTPLIDNFIIEAQSAQTIIPSLDVLCAVAEQYQLDVADIGSETGRDLCITDTTSMLDEIDAVIATQYSNIGVGGLLESELCGAPLAQDADGRAQAPDSKLDVFRSGEAGYTRFHHGA